VKELSILQAALEAAKATRVQAMAT
jgi:hypothetical protein